jgi:methionyl-tRNA formyltransferase
MSRVDSYLGGDLGLWALQYMSVDSIGQVISLDEKIAEAARSRGMIAWLANANALDSPASEVGFSVHYPRILKPELIAKYQKIYNLHPGYLPFGRGYYPIPWVLWERTPAGATLREITADVDQGPVVAQIRVEHYPPDTDGSLPGSERGRGWYNPYCVGSLVSSQMA